MANLSNINNKFLVTTGGNVGINTTSPGQKLVVTGNIGTSGSVLFDDNQGINFGNSNAKIYGSSSDGIKFNAGGSEGMRFNQSGNLGIGTASPSAKLDVNGGLNSTHAIFSGQVGRGLKISTENTLNNDDGVVYDAQTSTGKHLFKIAGAEAMRIDSSGNVGIGSGNPQNKLDVEQPAAVSARLLATGATSSSLKLEVKGGATQLTTTEILANSSGSLLFSTGTTTGTEKMRITSGGLVKITSGTANNTSYDSLVLAGGANSTSGSGAKMYLSGTVNDPIARGTIIEGLMTDNSNGHALVFSTSSSSAAPTERMRIDSSGNSTFAGSVRVTNATQSNYWLYNAAKTNGFLLGRSLASNDGQDFFIFDTVANSASMTIDSSQNATFAGNVTLPSGYLNVTTDGTVAYGLIVNSADQSHSRIRINNTGIGGNAWSIMAGTSAVSNDGFAIRNETTTTTALQFTNSGNATFTGNVEIDGNLTVDGSIIHGGKGGTFTGSASFTGTTAATLFSIRRNTTGQLIFDVFLTSDQAGGSTKKYVVAHKSNSTVIYNKIIETTGSPDFTVAFSNVTDQTTGDSVGCIITPTASQTVSYTIVVGFDNGNGVVVS